MRDFGSNRCPIIVFMDKSARIQSNPKEFQFTLSAILLGGVSAHHIHLLMKKKSTKISLPDSIVIIIATSIRCELQMLRNLFLSICLRLERDKTKACPVTALMMTIEYIRKDISTLFNFLFIILQIISKCILVGFLRGLQPLHQGISLLQLQ